MRRLALIISAGISMIASPGFAIIGGQRASEVDFKDVVRVNCGRGFSSATVVGARVILIPAHIKPAGQTKCRLALFNGESIEFIAYDFQHEPRGPRDGLDLAYGITAEPLSMLVPAQVGDAVKEGSILAVAGFGCTLPGGGGSSGVLHTGNAELSQIRAPNGEFTFMTEGSALCFGDSGSPAYATHENCEPYVVGIGSRSDVRERSWYVNLTHPEVRELLTQAAHLHNVDICGVTSACEANSP